MSGTHVSIPQAHGLYYVTRDDQTMWRLDTPGGGTRLQRPERDVLLALLEFVAEQIGSSKAEVIEQYILSMMQRNDPNLATHIQKLVRQGVIKVER